MKAKERESLKGMTLGELEGELAKARLLHGKGRFQHRSAPLRNPLELRTLRRRIAALETWIHQKQGKASAPRSSHGAKVAGPAEAGGARK